MIRGKTKVYIEKILKTNSGSSFGSTKFEREKKNQNQRNRATGLSERKRWWLTMSFKTSIMLVLCKSI